MASKKNVQPQKYEVLNIDGTKYRTNLIRKYNERTPWKPDDPKMVLAPIPGTVVKLAVKEGQKVTLGRNLYVLEAMKMKNRFNAERSGVIAKIHVSEGDVIPKETLVMEFAEEETKPAKSIKTRSKRSKEK